MTISSLHRCAWVNKEPLYQAYHDNEWGVACRDRQQLFEMLCLEGQQAGLSWITILRKRAAYQHAFAHFQPEQVAIMSEQQITTLIEQGNVVRHRKKLLAIVHNAQALLAMEATGESFVDFIWQFAPNVNTNSPIPTQTTESQQLAKALKKRGFKFVGATTCYAFMQACGLVNDHRAPCFLAPIIHSTTGENQ